MDKDNLLATARGAVAVYLERRAMRNAVYAEQAALKLHGTRTEAAADRAWVLTHALVREVLPVLSDDERADLMALLHEAEMPPGWADPNQTDQEVPF